MNALEVRAIVQALIPPFRQEMERLTGPLLERIASLEAMTPVEGRPGRDGIDGKSVDLGDVERLLEAHVERRFAALPPPLQGAPGEPGKDGRDVDPEIVKGMVQTLLAETVAAIPPADPGAPGRDGRDGLPGPAGPAARD